MNILSRNLKKTNEINQYILRQQYKILLQQNFIPKRHYFWNRKEKENDPSTQIIKRLQRDEEDSKNWKDISYLITKIKLENQKLPKLLPPKDPSLGDKLTVLVEMDDVLLHVFTPDEHEGYLLAPLR